jgi:hypothetical protein
MAQPLKYVLPNLIIGRVYESKRELVTRNASQFYRIEEKLSADFYRVTTHTPTPGKRGATRRKACAANTLRSCALALVDFDQEPEGLQSEEGALRRAERKRAAKTSRPPSTGGDKPRPVGVFLAAEVWSEVEAYAADQQRRADASGVEVKITMTEAIRCLVRKGLDAWHPEVASAPAPTPHAPGVSNGATNKAAFLST